jgi:hypothetical protein
MSTQEVFVQQFERLFRHYHEALQPEADAQSTGWNTLSFEQRNRLVGAARLAILELESDARMKEDCRKYYAKPGEAEWGC